MACSCNGSCSRCKRMGGRIKKQSGGLLLGPSHQQGGIPAMVGGTTPVELEGGEYIIRKSSVDKYGEGTIARINQGLVDASKLQKLRKGGKITTKKQTGGKIMRKRTTRPKRMARGGATRSRRNRRYQLGGMVNTGLGTNGAAMHSGISGFDGNMTRGQTGNGQNNPRARIPDPGIPTGPFPLPRPPMGGGAGTGNRMRTSSYRKGGKVRRRGRR